MLYVIGFSAHLREIKIKATYKQKWQRANRRKHTFEVKTCAFLGSPPCFSLRSSNFGYSKFINNIL